MFATVSTDLSQLLVIVLLGLLGYDLCCQVLIHLNIGLFYLELTELQFSLSDPCSQIQVFFISVPIALTGGDISHCW